MIQLENLYKSSFLQPIFPILKSSSIIFVAQFIFSRLRSQQTNISTYTKLPGNRVSDIRRFLGSTTPLLTTAMFLAETEESLKQFAKKHWILFAFNIMRILITIEPFLPIFKNLLNRASESEVLNQPSKKLSTVCEKIILPFHFSSNFYNKVLATPIVEEFIFRGIVQEVFCRQIPQLFLKRVGISPSLVDHPVSQMMRIGTSSLLFGMAHMEKHNNNLFYLFQHTIDSLEIAYLKENIGIHASILSHVNTNLYTYLAGQR